MPGTILSALHVFSFNLYNDLKRQVLSLKILEMRVLRNGQTHGLWSQMNCVDAGPLCLLLMWPLTDFHTSQALFPHLKKGDDATHRLGKEGDFMR